MVSEVMGQPLKAQSPMLVTELGTVSEVSEQPLKADSPILVTEFGIINVLKGNHRKPNFQYLSWN